MKDENISLLWQLQILEQEIEEVEKKTTLKKIRTKLNKLKSQHEKIKKEVGRQVVKYKEREYKITKIEQNNKSSNYTIKELQDKIYGGDITNVAVLSNLESELQQLQKEINDLEEEILEGMEEMEELKASIENKKQDIFKIQESYKKEKEQYDIEKIKLADKKKVLLTKTKKIQEKIDKEYLQQYKKVKENIKPPMAIINDGRCMECNMNISIILLKNIKVNSKVYICETCGRILYMEKK